MTALDPDPLGDATKYVDIGRDQRHAGDVATLGDAPHASKAQLKFALLAVTSGGVDPQARAFLRAVAGRTRTSIPRSALMACSTHTATVDRVEVAIGLHGDKVDPGLGGSKPPPAPNVDVDRNAINDLHVESMTATGTVTARSAQRAGAALAVGGDRRRIVERGFGRHHGIDEVLVRDPGGRAYQVRVPHLCGRVTPRI